jgi:hypothetical protein
MRNYYSLSSIDYPRRRFHALELVKHTENDIIYRKSGTQWTTQCTAQPQNAKTCNWEGPRNSQKSIVEIIHPDQLGRLCRLDDRETVLVLRMESPQIGNGDRGAWGASVSKVTVLSSDTDRTVPKGSCRSAGTSTGDNSCMVSLQPPPRAGVNFSTVCSGTSMDMHFSTGELRKYAISSCSTLTWLTTSVGITCCSHSTTTVSTLRITSR